MPALNIKSLSVADLLSLRSDIDKMLQTRRSELQAQLSQIGGGGGDESVARGSRNKGRKVAAKYRHPKTGETWSGRGGVAGWLSRELKAGKKREEFLIEKSAYCAAKTARGRPAMARKAK